MIDENSTRFMITSLSDSSFNDFVCNWRYMTVFGQDDG